MPSPKKHTFYPLEAVEFELREVPRGQLSERVNELILKGLNIEKEQAIAQAYRKHDAALAQSQKRNISSSSSRLLSKAAFEPEDEAEDYI